MKRKRLFKECIISILRKTVLFMILTAAAWVCTLRAEVKILSPDGWRVKQGSAEITVSSEHTSRTDKAAVIDYVTSGWQFVRYPFADLEVEDWRGGDIFKFDLYIDHPESLTFLRPQLSGEGVGNIYRQTLQNELPGQKWLRFAIPLRRGPGEDDPFPELDRANMGRLKLRLWPNRPPDYPRKEITLYIDNMRVVSTAERRKESLVSRLETMIESGLLSDDESSRAEDLRRKLDKVGTASFAEPEKLEQVTESVLNIEDAAEALIDTVIEQSLARRPLFRTATLIKDLGRAEKEYDRSWRTLAEIEEDRRESVSAGRVRALEKTLAMAGRQLERLRIQSDIERLYEDAGFAVGIPSWPQAWKSLQYDGPIGRRVDLRAARNEFEPFQLVILALENDLRGVRMKVSDLRSENGVIAAGNIEIAPMGWRKLRGEAGWIADMLRPDIDRFDVKAGRHQPVWVNVYVPNDTPPGEYTGTATIDAEGVDAQTIDISLEVWPFTLPKTGSLPAITNAGPARAEQENAEEFARLIIEYRWNPFQLYQWPEPQPLEWMQKLTDMGATLHNPLRISMRAADYAEGPDGKNRVTNKDIFFERLDPLFDKIREEDPDFMEHIMLYGFDEPSVSQAIAMDDLYGDFKERYDGVRTSFADLYGMWNLLPELLENVDVWTVSRGTLTANARDRIQEAGIEVWWWNPFAREDDPVRLRVQYWSTLKDGLDGILHYNLSSAPTGERPRPRFKPWPMQLWPEEERLDGTVLRKSEENNPISTITLEYWREGLEDVEYIYLLRQRRDDLNELVGDNPTDHQRNLLREADRLLRIPDTITTGLLGERAVDVGEVVVETGGHTEDMNEILATRTEVAELIVAIDEELE